MKLATVFPGQGSQALGMLKDLADKYPIVKQTFTEASDVLHYDLLTLVTEGPEAELNSTQKTQPAMLASGVAIYRLWQEHTSIIPTISAGHSLGEYTALVCADAIPFQAAVELVRARGNFMREAVPEGIGAMAAVIGLDTEHVEKYCAEVSTPASLVEPVNYNSPMQIVIAGHTDAVERVMPVLKEAGAKRVILLPISVPSHCSLMKVAAEKFANQLLKNIEFKKPTFPVLHNVNTKSDNDSGKIIQLLTEQLYKPVKWVDAINTISASGVDHVIEMGPGKVLTGLGKRIDRSLSQHCVHDQASFERVLDVLNG